MMFLPSFCSRPRIQREQSSVFFPENRKRGDVFVVSMRNIYNVTLGVSATLFRKKEKGGKIGGMGGG
jgi:hypothetical protein